MVTQVYYGERVAMIAEVAAFDPITIDVAENNCRYLVLPMGDIGQYDTEWFATRKEAKAHAIYIADTYTNCKVCAV